MVADDVRFIKDISERQSTIYELAEDGYVRRLFVLGVNAGAF
jgi:hypothetical protein